MQSWVYFRKEKGNRGTNEPGTDEQASKERMNVDLFSDPRLSVHLFNNREMIQSLPLPHSPNKTLLCPCHS